MFRKEVSKANQQHLYGQVSVIQPISLYSTSILIFVLFLIIIIYLSQANFSRKEVVKGYLLPGKGVVKVFTRRAGVIDRLYVEEGQVVQQGDHLLKIKNSQSLVTGVELSMVLVKELTLQMNYLQQELKANNKILIKNNSRIIEQKKQLTKKLTLTDEAINTKKIKLSLKNNKKEKRKRLLENKYISITEYDKSKEEYLTVIEEINELERSQIQTRMEISNLEFKHLELPEQQVINEVGIKRKISEIKSKITDLNNQFEFIKKAPESGVITAIQPNNGSKVDSDTLILSILPMHSPLEIELLLPTRSAGFIGIGNNVNIRFDAFPYQKFGFITGVISSIDKVVVLPSEKVFPIEINEAMYRIRAKLNQQFIKAYGKEFPLKVGMVANADIMLERRSLLEWLLDPVYTIKGKLG